jgi:hypothetical protein
LPWLTLATISAFATAGCDTFAYRPENVWRVEHSTSIWESDGLRVEVTGNRGTASPYVWRVAIRNVARPEPVALAVRSRGERSPSDRQWGVLTETDDDAADSMAPVTETTPLTVPVGGRSLVLLLRANRLDHLGVAYDLEFTCSDGQTVCPLRMGLVRTGP